MVLARQIFKELRKSGVIEAMDISSIREAGFSRVTLTLNGWKRYNAEKHGRASYNYGFLAMQFFDKNEGDKYGLSNLLMSS